MKKERNKKNVTVEADATGYVWFMIHVNKSRTYIIYIPLASALAVIGLVFMQRFGLFLAQW